MNKILACTLVKHLPSTPVSDTLGAMPGTSSLWGCGVQVHGSDQDDSREESFAQKMAETLIAMGQVKR